VNWAAPVPLTWLSSKQNNRLPNLAAGLCNSALIR
jgi:hypothetical protein